MWRSHARTGVHNPKHAFYGLTFVHPERLETHGWAAPTFAAFASSIIETGTKPEAMDGVRARLRELGLDTYDCLTPKSMHLLTANHVKVNGIMKPAMS